MGFRWSTRKAEAPSHVVWMTRSAKLAGIVADVQARRGLDQAIVLVTHFADTLSELAEHLDRAQVDWEPLTALRPQEIVHAGPPGRAAVHLLPSDLLPAGAPEAEPAARSGTASVIVAEMHFSQERCAAVRRFAAALPHETDVRHHLDLDEPFLRALGGGPSRKILSTLGLKEQDCLTHPMLDVAIERARQKVLRAALSDQPAETAQQWLQLNCPDLDRRSRSQASR